MSHFPPEFLYPLLDFNRILIATRITYSARECKIEGAAFFLSLSQGRRRRRGDAPFFSTRNQACFLVIGSFDHSNCSENSSRLAVISFRSVINIDAAMRPGIRKFSRYVLIRSYYVAYKIMPLEDINLMDFTGLWAFDGLHRDRRGFRESSKPFKKISEWGR